MSKAKVTVTIEEELLADIDRAARSTGASRSSVIEKALRSWEKSVLQDELMAGYRAMADEDIKVAEQNLSAGYEALK